MVQSATSSVTQTTHHAHLIRTGHGRTRTAGAAPGPAAVISPDSLA